MDLIPDFLANLSKELTVVYGGPATGKTLLCLTAVAQVVKQGKKVIFIDTEKGFFIERFQQVLGSTESKYLDNVIVTPHIASATEETRNKMASMAAENIIEALEGRMPPNLVK